MEYLLFAGYLFLFSWLVTRLRFFRLSGLSNSQLVIIFLLKIMAGIFYGWVGVYYGQFAYMFDTWGYHHASIEETKLLFNNPSEYFSNIFHSGHPKGFGGLFDSHQSYWNDLKANMFIKMLSLFNVFSFSNYYVNVIFYSFITLIGPVAFYRVLTDVFPGKKIQVLLATFLVPSFLYWTSGIHKDGLTFMAISLIVYHFYFGLKEKHISPKRLLVIFLSLLIILVFRNFMLVLLVPAFTAWYFAHRYPRRVVASFFITYAVCAVLFFTLRYISPGFDFPQSVVNKQQAFIELQGKSGIQVIKLKPDPVSFILNSPYALFATTIRPHPGDVKHILSLAAATETSFLLFLFLCFLVWRTNGIQSKQFLWFTIFFSFSFLLTIGYTVNFLGAIVRYRSIIIPFLIVPLVCLTNWDRIFAILFNNIKNKNNV